MSINLSTVCVCGNKILIRETTETVEENEEYEITYIHREIYRWQYNAAPLRIISKKEPPEGGSLSIDDLI